MSQFDVIIVGAGPAGIYAAYEFLRKSPQLKVLLLDKGRDIYSRRCPILENKISLCPQSEGRQGNAGCLPACSITAGFGGAGAYSDGKFNITTEFGGWLSEYISKREVFGLIKYVDDINLLYGATEEITEPTTDKVRDIERVGFGAGLKLLRAQVRHLGTEQNLNILKAIFDHLKERVEMRFTQSVEDIVVENKNGEKTIKGIVMANGEVINADKVIIVPGRDGSEWLENIITNQGLSMSCNKVDIGVRVETSDIVMREINENLYEGKFIFKTSVGTTVRTFCSNPSGHVVVENHSGVMAANGHSFRDPKLGSQNTNFALLVSHGFTEPFDKPTQYAKEICKRANDLSGGGVIIQTYGDILNSRRSTPKRISEGFLEPTLKEAVPGDLSLVLPYKTMLSLIEMVTALDHVTPGIATAHTLFYGVEAKFYSSRPKLSRDLETDIKGLYCGGDGAGVTRGLAQAGAAGVLMARAILARI